jgi:hypothetical protein
MNEPQAEPGEVTPLLAYKVVLQKVIDTRPSGTRQRLAEALGKNRSFVSQITNPAYATPVPAQHIETIFHICHFSAHEKSDFLEAYRVAHPSRLELLDGVKPMRRLVLELPDFGSPDVNRKADDAIHAVLRLMTELLLKPEAKPTEELPEKQP